MQQLVGLRRSLGQYAAAVADAQRLSTLGHQAHAPSAVRQSEPLLCLTLSLYPPDTCELWLQLQLSTPVSLVGPGGQVQLGSALANLAADGFGREPNTRTVELLGRAAVEFERSVEHSSTGKTTGRAPKNHGRTTQKQRSNQDVGARTMVLIIFGGEERLVLPARVEHSSAYQRTARHHRQTSMQQKATQAQLWAAQRRTDRLQPAPVRDFFLARFSTDDCVSLCHSSPLLLLLCCCSNQSYPLPPSPPLPPPVVFLIHVGRRSSIRSGARAGTGFAALSTWWAAREIVVETTCPLLILRPDERMLLLSYGRP